MVSRMAHKHANFFERYKYTFFSFKLNVGHSKGEGYEKMRDAIKKKMLKKGISPAKADKEAKRIAAATWNKKHPKSPVTNKPHKKRR